MFKVTYTLLAQADGSDGWLKASTASFAHLRFLVWPVWPVTSSCGLLFLLLRSSVRTCALSFFDFKPLLLVGSCSCTAHVNNMRSSRARLLVMVDSELSQIWPGQVVRQSGRCRPYRR